PASVLHLAWIAAAGEYRHSAENLAWVRASLELAASLGTAQRLVVAGSCMDDAGPDRHLTEQWPSLYGVAKSALYRLLCYAGGKANLPHFAWARIFFFYGPEQRGARLVPEVIRCLLADRPAICGPGTPVRDYLHADDVASALVAFSTAAWKARWTWPPAAAVASPASPKTSPLSWGVPICCAWVSAPQLRSRTASSATTGACCTSWAGTRKCRWTKAWPEPSPGGANNWPQPRGLPHDLRLEIFQECGSQSRLWCRCRNPGGRASALPGSVAFAGTVRHVAAALANCRLRCTAALRIGKRLGALDRRQLGKRRYARARLRGLRSGGDPIRGKRRRLCRHWPHGVVPRLMVPEPAAAAGV